MEKARRASIGCDLQLAEYKDESLNNDTQANVSVVSVDRFIKIKNEEKKSKLLSEHEITRAGELISSGNAFFELMPQLCFDKIINYLEIKDILNFKKALPSLQEKIYSSMEILICRIWMN